MEVLLYLSCGLSAGLLGGYLGLGGGIVMVPFLTVLAGVDFKAAVPVSATAIVVNSLSSSNEYVKKGMADMELVILLSVFMVMGNITGSNLSQVVPADFSRILFTVLLIYTAFSFLKGRKPTEKLSFEDHRTRYFMVCTVIAFITGVLAGLLGVGGGVILVPTLYLIVGLPLTTARGTSALMIGFSAAASATVYFLNNQVNLQIVAPVIAGIVVGGKIGGRFGTVAKPLVVKVLFFIVMLYLAFRLSSESIMRLF
ncbi:MAG: sulfite exporter TauE/SafE family protein [bacterium]|nr:sulfite exporter TauE/SafE family protein [bacterium]